jgi:preprotein translocase subunit SecE
MANEKKAVPKKAMPKAKKDNFFVRFGRGFVGFFVKIGVAFKNMWHELKKVTWPTREKLVNYTIIVVLTMVFLMVVIGLLDMGASSLVSLIMSN